MEVVVKTFNQLTNSELYEILRLRVAVFVLEQKCLYQEIDGIDYQSFHLYLKDEDGIMAYLRMFYQDDQTIQIGRVLTTKRNLGWGYQLMTEALDYLKEKTEVNKVYLQAQSYAIGFYQKLGFNVVSKSFLEDGIEHVAMELKI